MYVYIYIISCSVSICVCVGHREPVFCRVPVDVFASGSSQAVIRRHLDRRASSGLGRQRGKTTLCGDLWRDDAECGHAGVHEAVVVLVHGEDVRATDAQRDDTQPRQPDRPQQVETQTEEEEERRTIKCLLPPVC